MVMMMMAEDSGHQEADCTIGALIIRMGFWGPTHYIVIIRNPKIVLGVI